MGAELFRADRQADMTKLIVAFHNFCKKSSNTKFHKNRSSGSRVTPCGRIDRNDEANSRFSQFF